MPTRPLPVLLQIIGADDGAPLTHYDLRIVEAYMAGNITSAEGRHLQKIGKQRDDRFTNKYLKEWGYLDDQD